MTRGEHSEVQFGRTPIAFEIRRSEARTTVALTIEREGCLVVTAPVAVSVERLNGIVKHKGPWVIQRMRRVREGPTPQSSAREYVSGETVLYLGRQLRLRVIECAEPSTARMWAGWYEVPIPRGMRGRARGNEVRSRLVESLRSHAERQLALRLDEVCRERRMRVPPMVVREQAKRWGSCDARGVLRINWRIVQAPTPLIEYVLLHELVHREHPNHTSEFWSALGRALPDYETRRDALRKLGSRLTW